MVKKAGWYNGLGHYLTVILNSPWTLAEAHRDAR